jgi:aerobic C4-dicarboxylate transport protein
MNSTTVTHDSRKTKPLYQDMSVQVFAGMALGALIGWLWPQSAEWMGTLGDLFIRLIAMFVGLIIFCAVVHGIATVREAKKVGRIAIKALIYFEVVTTFALVIGLAMVNLLGPGRGMHVDLQSIAGSAVDPYLKTAQQISGSGFLLSIVPHTAISAFTEGNVLQVVFLSVLFAFGLHAIGADGEPILQMIELTKRVVFKIIGYIMWLAPIGAMGAIGFTVGRFGIGSLVSLGAMVGEFYLTCILFICLVLWPIAYWNGISLWHLVRYIRTELLIVVGTSSSESVFPQLVQKLTSLGCEESVVGLVLPTGYAFNHDGTCLYFAAASLFLRRRSGSIFRSGSN